MKYLYPALILFAFLAVRSAHAFDSDDDGIPNKYDLCPKDPEDKDGFEDQDGCPDLDNDKDGVSDALDKCPNVPEDRDGYQDADGCPDNDNDKDGIPDDKDKCPNEPEDKDGFQDNDGCPDPDNDGDGIIDEQDKCPEAAEDKDGFEDADGCPDPDNDKDGIKDNVDKCPNEAENMNGVEDDDGCPDHTMPALLPTQSYPLVRFRSATAELTVEAEQPLDQLAKQLKEYSDKMVEIRVYTWYKGKKKEAYLDLLKQRSKAIVDYLVNQGVSPAQLKEIDYTLENFEAFKGTENDFNQEKPMELRLLN
jgi:outer membrane protein OmpA-like peptidoglycan-associated protein